jgi:hypothetical protein
LPLHHFAFGTLPTVIYASGTISVTITACQADGTPIDTFKGKVILKDKLGYLQTVTFDGTSTKQVVVTIPQSPNKGTNTIFAYFEGKIMGTSTDFFVLINKDIGGTVILTTNIGTAKVEFGSATEDFYVVITPSPTGVDIPKYGVATSIYEIIAYNSSHTQFTGTFTTPIYIEIPYLDKDQDGVVDDTTIGEETLKLYVFRNNIWQEVDNSGVDTTRNVVYGFVNSLSIFIPIGEPVAPDKLGKISVYPNPFKPNSGLGHTHITFGSKRDISRRLTRYATIRIYDVAGDLIKTLEVVPADKGQKVWNVRNEAGKEVASGVYIYLITNPQGEKCIGKLAIIR